MLTKIKCIEGQFCLPEKMKCKGQVNNWRMSYMHFVFKF